MPRQPSHDNSKTGPSGYQEDSWSKAHTHHLFKIGKALLWIRYKQQRNKTSKTVRASFKGRGGGGETNYWLKHSLILESYSQADLIHRILDSPSQAGHSLNLFLFEKKGLLHSLSLMDLRGAAGQPKKPLVWFSHLTCTRVWDCHVLSNLLSRVSFSLDR